MKQIKQKIILLSSIVLIIGCAEDNSKLTTALSDGTQAGIKSAMENNSSKDKFSSKVVTTALVDGAKVGIKSAMDNNSSKKDNNSSGDITTKVIGGVANYLKDDKDKKKE
ncbi:MAG TPA: hypothetical protein ENK88_00310 [Campylobacterales bacterium]|nr:hypothetical protein [Campylobacterales bacterium]